MRILKGLTLWAELLGVTSTFMAMMIRGCTPSRFLFMMILVGLMTITWDTEL